MSGLRTRLTTRELKQYLWRPHAMRLPSGWLLLNAFEQRMRLMNRLCI